MLDSRTEAGSAEPGLPSPGAGGRFSSKSVRTLEVITLVFSLLVAACFSELLARISFKKFFPREEIVRQVLAGHDKQIRDQEFNSIGQPYLLYIPAPGFSRGGILQHNEHGYRGPAVPLRRTPGKVRILFLGGSTTYGAMPHPDETYPAQVGRILQERSLTGLQGVEVINGGILWGSTAEIMTHYLFKYRYYRPDIVVINTGVNDAQAAVLTATYQPDYSHWRQQFPCIRPLPARVRWIMRSRIIALLAIRFFYSDVATGALFARFDDSPPPAAWYSYAHADSETSDQVPEEDLAFKHNLRTIIREIRADGAELLLVPDRLNPDTQSFAYETEAPAEATRNERILRQLATAFHLDVAPFPAAVISPENWIDAVHVNERGELEKAHHVVEYLVPIIRRVVARHGARRQLASRSRSPGERVLGATTSLR